MLESTTLKVRLSAEMKGQLARVAEHTRRRQSVLGAEAIADYVTRELAIVDGIERGRQDVRAGRVVSNDEAFQQLQAIIDAAPT